MRASQRARSFVTYAGHGRSGRGLAVARTCANPSQKSQAECTGVRTFAFGHAARRQTRQHLGACDKERQCDDQPSRQQQGHSAPRRFPLSIGVQNCTPNDSRTKLILYSEKIAGWRWTDPQIDWSGVKVLAGQRRVVLWLSETDSY